jgi:hypothetical protein
MTSEGEAVPVLARLASNLAYAVLLFQPGSGWRPSRINPQLPLPLPFQSRASISTRHTALHAPLGVIALSSAASASSD